MRRGAPELGLVAAQLHVRPEGAAVKSGLGNSQRSLLAVDGLLERDDVPLLFPDLLQDLSTQSYSRLIGIFSKATSSITAHI